MTFRRGGTKPLRLTPRQTRFVATVALHSGYCLRRQYMAFAGLQYGKVVRDFLEHLVARRLAVREPCRADRGFLYHLQARSIYRALRQDDNRNRRHASLAAIGRKLMVLDFVIAHSGGDWYATQDDKVDFFTQRLGVPLTDLPQRPVVPGAEDGGRIVQERGFFLLHPGLIGHVGVDVMHLPAIRDRKMIRQDLIIDENEAVFPEISIAGTVIGVFDEIAVGVGRVRQIRREFGRPVDLFEIVAAMGPDWPRQDGGR